MSGVITDWDRDDLLNEFKYIAVSARSLGMLELIAEAHRISDEEMDLVRKYKSGVYVWIFNYSGNLQYHLRSDIDRFPENCRHAGVKHEVIRIDHDYFEDIRNSIILGDKYGGLLIQGLFEAREYLRMLNDHFYQKHTMVPKMRRLLFN